MYASCRLLKIITNTGKTISDFLSDVPKTNTTPEIRVEYPDEKKFEVVKKITEHFPELNDVIDIDGWCFILKQRQTCRNKKFCGISIVRYLKMIY